ncbi:MAG: shikimate dehydrogenase [Fimbriimonadaceae bacterium]|nr:shikimate dehydrogenase [Fimbriimonadaceae bacterium]
MTTVYDWRALPSDAKFAVIGDPIHHSLSPAMQNALLQSIGEPGTYIALHVPPVELAAALEALITAEFAFVNVTVPHKEAVRAWCHSVHPDADTIGAVNTLWPGRRFGINTDAPGFLAALDLAPPPGPSALVLGAGGSARAVVHALLGAGYRVGVWNRSDARRAALLADFPTAQPIPTLDELDAFDLIVNTTSASLAGDAVSIRWDSVRTGITAMDLAYGLSPTPFAASASRAGARVIDGTEMLIQQGALAMEAHFNRPIPRDPMRAAITAELRRRGAA